MPCGGTQRGGVRRRRRDRRPGREGRRARRARQPHPCARPVAAARRAWDPPPLAAPPPAPGPGSDEFARSWYLALRRSATVRAIEVRTFTGSSVTSLLTSDGFKATGSATGAVVEALLAPTEGPWRLVRFAARGLADLDCSALAEQALATVGAVARGDTAQRGLTDVVLAPGVAALLVAALGRRLAAPSPLIHGRIAPAWRLVDERAGPVGLAPQPFDGEGVPSRPILLVGGGKLHERLACWRDAAPPRIEPGGAVRASFCQPPIGGPANLVVHAAAPVPADQLLATLGRGVVAVLPATALEIDDSGRFSLQCAALHIEGGRPAGAYPLIELRGSLRRLLGGLAACGDDPTSHSLDCAVTTPSLLVRQLEIA